MTLVDAPSDYIEITDPVDGIAHCGLCPTGDQPVNDEPCSTHGPAAVVDDDTQPLDAQAAAKLADLAEFVMKTRSVNSRPILDAIASKGFRIEHFTLLERWGVIGRTNNHTRVPIIHEAHVGLVRAKIIVKRGIVAVGTHPLTHLAMPPLTAQHRHLIELVAEGTRNGAIARRLNVSEDTIKTHLRRIFRQMHAVDRTHLVHIAHQRGLFGAIPAKAVTRRG